MNTDSIYTTFYIAYIITLGKISEYSKYFMFFLKPLERLYYFLIFYPTQNDF